ncbi:MAG: TetR/AcrR family transcriptional regulator [Rhodoferax sp.]|nr:TetR/AcrR family transcriptional regulator [Rhodoferax sp.]
MGVKTKAKLPDSGRGLITIEKLVKAAGEVLAETGFEKLTSNAICARAGLTPPAFYHYYADKYEVLEELAERLLRKQSDAFGDWVKASAQGSDPMPSVESLERLFHGLIDIASAEPGGIWTIRALRALPNLNHVRLRWQRQYTDEIFRVVRSSIEETAWPLLWSRIRILVEFGYVVDELVYEEDKLSRETVVREAARLIHGNLRSIFET